MIYYHKEAALVYILQDRIIIGGKAKLSMQGERGWSQADAMQLLKEKDTRILLVGHSLMAIHRLIKID